MQYRHPKAGRENAIAVKNRWIRLGKCLNYPAGYFSGFELAAKHSVPKLKVTDESNTSRMKSENRLKLHCNESAFNLKIIVNEWPKYAYLMRDLQL